MTENINNAISVYNMSTYEVDNKTLFGIHWNNQAGECGKTVLSLEMATYNPEIDEMEMNLECLTNDSKEFVMCLLKSIGSKVKFPNSQLAKKIYNNKNATCAVCNNTIQTDWEFCPKCGNDLESE